jgi:ABC-type polysaccharide/polyol phosphate transport system ATPase subunit
VSAAAIEADHVSKRFRVLVRGYAGIKGMIGDLARGRRPEVRDVTALEDVSLSVAPGESLAVIGRNGSGKSTLLSLLAHVLLPDQGVIRFPACRDPRHPRLAPLLDLGAGFHPDLTGRENVYFNGSILGLTRREMEARFAEIVAFADLDPAYLDAPVRTYSQGMLLRLGFAVAASTNPEIILVDEVLAVGDEAFQERCYARIAEFQRAGCTLVIVSHDMNAVRRVATRAVWLRHGRVAAEGPVAATIRAYHDAFGIPD